LKFTLPKIYPITDRAISGLSHIDQVRRLIDGGATLIQIREKVGSGGEFYDAAVEAIEYARLRSVKIIVNDRVDIALASGADGVHLGQNDLGPEHARKLLGDNAIIGFSTHSIEQALDAVKLPVDYIAIGPIYATSSKTDADPVIGLDGLKAVRNAIGNFPLVAIGGIDRNAAAQVLSAGADSVAVISDLLRFPNEIARRMAELNKIS
jgi:thiamine-phosphate pyrophosphorylase